MGMASCLTPTYSTHQRSDWSTFFLTGLKIIVFFSIIQYRPGVLWCSVSAAPYYLIHNKEPKNDNN